MVPLKFIFTVNGHSPNETHGTNNSDETVYNVDQQSDACVHGSLNNLQGPVQTINPTQAASSVPNPAQSRIDKGSYANVPRAAPVPVSGDYAPLRPNPPNILYNGRRFIKAESQPNQKFPTNLDEDVAFVSHETSTGMLGNNPTINSDPKRETTGSGQTRTKLSINHKTSKTTMTLAMKKLTKIRNKTWDNIKYLPAKYLLVPDGKLRMSDGTSYFLLLSSYFLLLNSYFLVLTS